MPSDKDQPDCKYYNVLKVFYSLKHAIDEMKLVSSFEKGKVHPESAV